MHEDRFWWNSQKAAMEEDFAIRNSYIETELSYFFNAASLTMTVFADFIVFHVCCWLTTLLLMPCKQKHSSGVSWYIVNKFISHSTVVLYMGIIKVWGFLPKNSTYKSAKCLLSDSMAALVRHSQAQNVSRSTLNFTLSCYEILISYLPDFSTDWLSDWLTDWLTIWLTDWRLQTNITR